MTFPSLSPSLLRIFPSQSFITGNQGQETGNKDRTTQGFRNSFPSQSSRLSTVVGTSLLAKDQHIQLERNSWNREVH